LLMLDGWRESEGVQVDIRIPGELGKPVRYLQPEATGTPVSCIIREIEGASKRPQQVSTRQLRAGDSPGAADILHVSEV